MKVLHLTTSLRGGGGIAPARVVHALNQHGECEAELRSLEDFQYTVNYRAEYWRKRIKNSIVWRSHNTNPIYHSWGVCSCGVVEQINQSDADIVHLHWINDRFLSISDIARIRRPLVWTLHDSWPFCGAEHHPNIRENDKRYLEGYKSSNFPASSSGYDVDKWIWRWKKWCWRNLQCRFTAPSDWEARCFEESALFLGQKCTVIPNTLDLKTFFPADKNTIRKELKIPADKKVILIGAHCIDDPNKGSSLLLNALEELRKKEKNLFLLCFGAGMPSFPGWENSFCSAGYISSESQMAKLYQAADVFVCPSIIEIFSLTSLEAVACNTPVIAFATGGIPDIVKHKKNGYLAQPFEAEDLAAGIQYCLDELPSFNRNEFVTAFSEESVAKAFQDIYNDMLNTLV